MYAAMYRAIYRAMYAAVYRSAQMESVYAFTGVEPTHPVAKTQGLPLCRPVPLCKSASLPAPLAMFLEHGIGFIHGPWLLP